ncbi:DUF2470 domain-containing protein [Pseudonocardia sp. KRD291]|uniref:DUF2470 domain-containing protein n=1 Tax=Pseudonocardia sp. KRD291 TaxID=2792007 RepID=UPI001C4A107C|nr:DUF2470 domain-containing protein [Pseudonocardia sp. KRD291]MBW0104074.1 DUF2470 domain-containing protein [Pseudonocardia sp. KRD291]
MGTTRTRRPPAPTAAERARSLVARGGRAAIVGTGEPDPITPLMHHVHPDGATDLLLPDDSVLLERLRGNDSGELPVMLELTEHTPVPMPDQVRELLWIVGWLHEPTASAARHLALRLAELRPHPRLLDVGHNATLVRLRPGSAVYSDAESSAATSADELAAARPDPFCLFEHQWLAHLEEAHPEVFTSLMRHLPSTLRLTEGARVRPLGVDRLGLRIRVQTPSGDHDVRLAWSSEATTVEELRERLGELVGCPFRAAS